MTKEQLKEIYWWEIKALKDGHIDIMDLVSLVYQGGYDDGLADQKDKVYDI